MAKEKERKEPPDSFGLRKGSFAGRKGNKRGKERKWPSATQRERLVKVKVGENK